MCRFTPYILIDINLGTLRRGIIYVRMQITESTYVRLTSDTNKGRINLLCI